MSLGSVSHNLVTYIYTQNNLNCNLTYSQAHLIQPQNIQCSIVACTKFGSLKTPLILIEDIPFLRVESYWFTAEDSLIAALFFFNVQCKQLYLTR